MLEYLNKNVWMRFLVKALVLTVFSSMIIYMNLAAGAVAAGVSGKTIIDYFNQNPLIVSGVGLISLLTDGSLFQGSDSPLYYVLAALCIIAAIVAVKCAFMYYWSIGEEKVNHGSEPFPRGGVMGFTMKGLILVLRLLLGPFFIFLSRIFSGLTATYVDSRGNELDSASQLDAATGSIYPSLIVYLIVVSLTGGPLLFALAVLICFLLRYALPYELSAAAAYKLNLTDRNISLKSLLLDSLAIIIYAVYILLMQQYLTEHNLFTGTGYENVFPLYLICLLPLILLLFTSTAFTLGIERSDIHTSLSTPFSLKEKQTGFIILGVLVLALHLFGAYAGMKAGPEVGPRYQYGILLSFLQFLLTPLVNIVRYGDLPGSPAFCSRFNSIPAAVAVVLIQVVFFVSLIVKIIRTFSSSGRR